MLSENKTVSKQNHEKIEYVLYIKDKITLLARDIKTKINKK